MELLLPVALKLFPNMLPSTFTDKFKEVSRGAVGRSEAGADRERARFSVNRTRRSASCSRFASRWPSSSRRRFARVVSRVQTRSRKAKTSRSSSARFVFFAFSRTASRGTDESCAAYDRSGVRVRALLQMKLSTSPSCLRTTSRSTTCPDHNSSPCAGTIFPPFARTTIAEAHRFQLYEHQRFWNR